MARLHPITLSLRRIMTLVCLPLGMLVSSAQAKPPTTTAPKETELLRDHQFTQGITQRYANHLKPAERAECLARWTAKGITKDQWAFWEISEQLYFARNPATPSLPKPGSFQWSTINQAKQCSIENGAVHLLFDTSKEWREGGNLNLPDRSGQRPRYGDPNTTWPHFLIGQHLTGNNKATALIPEADKLLFNKYDQLRLRLDIKLNKLQKSSTWDHRAEYGAKNHAIFDLAFIIMPKTANRLSDAKRRQSRTSCYPVHPSRGPKARPQISLGQRPRYQSSK